MWTNPEDGTTIYDSTHDYYVTVRVTFDYTITVGNPDDLDAIDDAISDVLYSDLDYEWDITDIEDAGEAYYE